MNYCLDLPHGSSIFGQWLYDWQTLIAGGLALVAAYWAGKGLNRQITQSDFHHWDELSRRHNAARLTMPLALSTVDETVQKISDEIASELETFGPNGFERTFEHILHGKDRKRFDPITVPSAVITAFQQFVETLDRKSDIKHVAELIANAQILTSKFNSFDLMGVAVKSDLEILLLDAAKVKLLNDMIFNYARFVDDASFGIVGAIPHDEAWGKIHGCAQGLVFLRSTPDDFFPGFGENVNRYKSQNVSPWLEKFGQ